MEYTLHPIATGDGAAIIDIFNYYVENSFAAYPEAKLPYGAFAMFQQMSQGYPRGTVQDPTGKVVGFGMLRPHNPLPVFSHTAEITYFIDHEHTGKGLGRLLLTFLIDKGRHQGITNVLASISSLNTGSIRFHQQNGFIECGCFKNVGRKHGQWFDTLWMQKKL